MSVHNCDGTVVSVNVADKKVDGRYTYPGFIGLTSFLQVFYFAYGLVIATLAWSLTRD